MGIYGKTGIIFHSVFWKTLILQEVNNVHAQHIQHYDLVHLDQQVLIPQSYSHVHVNWKGFFLYFVIKSCF